jgi:hypothetical protein
MNRVPASGLRLISLPLAVTIVFTATTVAAREKTDVVILTNGDRVTGEIKQLDVGILTIKTDHMGTLDIEWVAVQSLESDQSFEITDLNGDTYYGVLNQVADGSGFEILGFDGLYLLGHDQIARVAQIEDEWWQRWRGYADLGVVLASANKQQDVTFDAAADYRQQKFVWRNSLSASLSDRDDAARTSRADVTSSFQRFRPNRWFWVAQVQFTHNEELNLQLRSSVTGGFGRFMRQTPRSQLSAVTGLSAVRENYYGEEAGEWSSELVLGGSYRLFVFEGRETTLTTTLQILPSLTVSGRYRIEFYSSFRRKLVRDFTIAFTLEESYDSKPPEGSQSSDLRFRTTLGWSF